MAKTVSAGLLRKCVCASSSRVSLAPVRAFSTTSAAYNDNQSGSRSPMDRGMRNRSQGPAFQERTWRGPNTVNTVEQRQAAIEDMSNSIEQLSQKLGQGTGTNTQGVFNPRANAPTARERQAVSGRAFLNGHYYNPQTLQYDSITQKERRSARPILGPTKAEAIQQDLLHIHGLNPGKISLHDDSYKNAPIIAEFMTEMGKIMPRAQSGLTRKSQRSIGKAIRRARAVGLLPVLSRGGPRNTGSGWK